MSFFLIFIQLCDSWKIHYLTREFRVELHVETNIVRIASFRDSRGIGYHVLFNAEFPRQVMNFPIVSSWDGLMSVVVTDVSTSLVEPDYGPQLPFEQSGSLRLFDQRLKGVFSNLTHFLFPVL